MTGSGLGAFVFAPFTKYLIESSGWRYTMVLLGCITLQCCVFGALLRPFSDFLQNNDELFFSHLYYVCYFLLTISLFKISLEHVRYADEALQGVFDETKKEQASKKESMRRVSSRLSQVSREIITETTSFNLLWEDLRFSLAVVSNFLVSFVYFVPFIYIPIRSTNLNINNYEVFLSTIGTRLFVICNFSIIFVLFI
jgi:hypothetical protein